MWFVGHMAMYLWIGSNWGLVWYMWNLPLSELLKRPLWSMGESVYFCAVTGANAILLWGILWLLTWPFRKYDD
jgi:hypothetical protein